MTKTGNSVANSEPIHKRMVPMKCLKIAHQQAMFQLKKNLKNMDNSKHGCSRAIHGLDLYHELGTWDYKRLTLVEITQESHKFELKVKYLSTWS